MTTRNEGEIGSENEGSDNTVSARNFANAYRSIKAFPDGVKTLSREKATQLAESLQASLDEKAKTSKNLESRGYFFLLQQILAIRAKLGLNSATSPVTKIEKSQGI